MRTFPLNRHRGLNTSHKVILLAVVAIGIFAMRVDAQSLRRSAIVRAVEQARPSVVNITGQKMVPVEDQYSDARKRVNGMGTGVVVDHRGYILTNYHVVEGVRRINVTTSNGSAYVARLVANDPTTDLAIIKIPTRTSMTVVHVGSSKDIYWGETVIAMGNAYGYENTVTTGIVSALHRNVQVNDKQAYRDLIQTDASINPGNSGGPLLNIDGDMIGINVAVRVGAQGIGFAIPVNQALQVAARLMSVERLSGVWHGVIHEDQMVGTSSSVVVKNVKPDSPASRAGLRPGDVIQQVAGQKVGRGLDVECALIGTRAGETVDFAVVRDNKAVDVQLGLEAQPSVRARKPLAETIVKDPVWTKLGVRLEPVSQADVRKQIDKFRGGLRVTAIRAGGVAAQEGIQKNDVLVGMRIGKQDWETISLDNLHYIMEEANEKGHSNVPFYVVRNGKTLSGSFTPTVLR